MTHHKDIHSILKPCFSNCFYCGRFMDTTVKKGCKPTWDHVEPVSRGGAHLMANLVLACEKCNQDKGALTLEEYRGFYVLVRNFYNLKQNSHIKLLGVRFWGERWDYVRSQSRLRALSPA